MTSNATGWIRILGHSSLSDGAAEFGSARLNVDITPTFQHIEVAAFHHRMTVADVARSARGEFPHTNGGRQ